jgi:hypothetical protein
MVIKMVKKIDITKFEPIITFTCPKCKKIIEMRETPVARTFNMMTKYHSQPSFFGNDEPTEENLRLLREDGIKNPIKYLQKEKKEKLDKKKNYCMSFKKRPLKIYQLWNGFYYQDTPIVFIKLDKLYDDEKTLELSLEMLKTNRFGLEIAIWRTKKYMGTAYLWKNHDTYYGIIEGLLTTANFIASKSFKDAIWFGSRYFHWGVTILE